MAKALRRILFAGTVGFLAGVFTTSMLIWNFGNFVGSREASLAWPPAAGSATTRWGTDDLDLDALLDIEASAMVLDGLAVPAAAVSASLGRTTGEPSAPEVRSSLGSVSEPAMSPLAERRLVVPVFGIPRASLQPSFDHPRGRDRVHQALDIMAARHTPVVAVEDGRVARLFQSSLGGTTVYQQDPSGQYVYYYAHLERYADGLREGQSVTRGQVLGYVGTSGNAPENAPHLHFAIYRANSQGRWWGGTPIDPYPLLADATPERIVAAGAAGP